MGNEELREHLQEIHQEIEKTQTVDKNGSELLRDLDMDIRALLERSGELPGQLHPSLVRQLEGALNHFEITHPDLTLLISRLLESLSNAGI
jgi:hypothetical protein